MGNKSWGSDYENINPYKINKKDTSEYKNGPGNKAAYEYHILKSTNNYPLGDINDILPPGYIPGETNDNWNGVGGSGGIVGGSGNNGVGNTTIIYDVKDTYERVYKNLESLPHEINMANKKFIVTDYTHPDDSVTTVTTDMTTDYLIISTISGNVPDGIDLVKTTTIDPDLNNMVVTYS